MANTTTRLITLLMLLQRQPNQKATDLAAKLGISVRSLHRYMGMLEEIGIPVCSERGPYGGFSLVRGYRMPPLVLTPEEAVAVHLGTSLVREMWGKLYEDAAQGALAKLDNLLPDEQRHEIAWARRSLVATGMHRLGLPDLDPVLEKLRRAIREQRQVRLSYRGKGQPEPQQRVVDAYALVHRWGCWYMFGHCHLREAVRCFRLDRIAELTLLDSVFQTPADFDIQQHLTEQWDMPAQVHVRLRFSPQAMLIARDNHMLFDSAEEQPDGSTIVTMTMPDLNWAASMVLSFGSLVVVLEPEELRRQVREWAGAIVEQYAPAA